MVMPADVGVFGSLYLYENRHGARVCTKDREQLGLRA